MKVKNRVTGVLLTFALLFTFPALPAFAETDTGDVTADKQIEEAVPEEAEAPVVVADIREEVVAAPSEGESDGDNTGGDNTGGDNTGGDNTGGEGDDPNPDDPDPNEPVVINVDDYVYDPSYARDGINQALATAAQSGTPEKPATVKFTSGTTYVVDQILFCYSNTTIDATGATIKASGYEGSIMKGAHTTDGEAPDIYQSNRCRAEEAQPEGVDPPECGHGAYTQTQNVTITGGTWIAGGAEDSDLNTQGLQFRHADTITFEGMTVKGSTNHAMNLAGSRGITVTGCSFPAPVKYTGDSKTMAPTEAMEAIHLDICNEDGEPNARPLDGTACKDVLVTENTFTGGSGMGCHQNTGATSGEARATNVTITNNAFTNMGFGAEKGNAINYVSVDGLTITGNTANGIGDFVNLKKDCKNVTISGNTVTNLYGHGLMAGSDCTGSIVGHTFPFAAGASTTANGIYIGSGSEFTVEENTITNAPKHGISVDGGAVTLANNQITFDASKTGASNGINVANNANVTSSNNTVTNAPQIGISVSNAKLVSTGDKVTGSKANAISLSGAVSGTSINGATVTDAGQHGVSVNGGTVTLADSTISYAASKTGAYNGINVANNADVTSNNNTVTNAPQIGISVSNAKLVSTGDKVTGNKANAINLTGAVSGTSVKQATVTNAGQHGITVNGGTVTLADNAINYDSSKTGSYNGINVSNSAVVTSNRNTITNAPQIGISISGAKIVSTGDKVTDSKSNGIQMTNATAGSTISGATVLNAGGIGILLNDVASVAVKNSTVENSAKNGITLVASSKKSVSAVIQGNHSLDNKGSFDYYIDPKANQGTLTSCKNNCSGKGTPGFYNGTSYALDASNEVCDDHDTLIDLSGATVGNVKNKTYIGSALGQSPTVTLDGKTLKLKDDYVITYKNNINVGTATMTISARGNYKGTITKTFKITPVKLGSATLPYGSLGYTGAARTQNPVVKATVNKKLLTLKKGTDYTVSFTNNKNVGKATVTITGKGNYTGTFKRTFNILPKGTSITKTGSAKKCFSVTWAKQATKMSTSPITGYQIQYSTVKGFKSGNKLITVKGAGSIYRKVASLPSNKTYYVRIRTYKTVSGATYYSPWSGAKAVKTK